MTTWHIVTGEFPPMHGGVGDYAAQLAAALESAGDRVTVWTPGGTLPDRFGSASRRVLDAAIRESPGTILLQYVPNALGARGMNLPFCRWLRDLPRAGVDVRVMFHEPYFYYSFARPWRNVLAVVQRSMARMLLQAADTVYVSTETWRRYLEPLAPIRSLQVLPIPSNIPAGTTPLRAQHYRHAIAPAGEPVVGHFGTYGDHVAAELVRLLPSIAGWSPAARFAFVGAGSREFLLRLATRCPEIPARSWTPPGRLDSAEVAAVLQACDVLIQPYPDGITTRRTSAMAGLRNGIATVTTNGTLTESIWRDSGAAALAPVGDAKAYAEQVAALLRDPRARASLGRRGAEVYDRHFSLERTLAVLRGPAAAL